MALPPGMGYPSQYGHISMKTNPPELYACIYVREFPAQALLRLRPDLRDQPVVVLERDPPLEQLCSLNHKARALGLTHGMTRVEVDTFSGITALSRSETEESAARQTLLECAGAFSPRVEDHAQANSFHLVIDIAGTEKLYGPPMILAKTLHGRIKALGFITSIAICTNFHAAVALARGLPKRQVTVIPPGDESAALAALPTAVLNLSEEHAQTLDNWGVYTLGMLSALPETALIARLGQSGKRLRHLARGEQPHLFLPVEPAFHLEETIQLDTPVELLDSLLFIVGLMLEQLILRATARIFALQSVTATLYLEGGLSHTRTVRPALPSTDRAIWLKLLHLDLEAHPPGNAILALTLTAEPGTTSKVQLGLFSPQLPEPMRLDVTLARIQSIVGEDCVGKAVLDDNHRPDSFHMEHFQIDHFRLMPHIIDDAIHNAIETRQRAAVRQIRPPETITVSVHNRRPIAFYFRQAFFAVEHAYGPWLLSGDWWNPSLWSNEQWDLIARANDGALLCCCLIRNLTQSCWQMTALYD